MKTLKKFSTHEQYINYLVNNATDIDFVSICDDERIYQFHSLLNKGKLIEYIYDSYSSTTDLRCYIDTGLIPNDDNWKFISVFKVNNYNVPNTYGAIFAAYTSENHNTYRILRNGSQTNGDILVHANSKAGGSGKIFYNCIPQNLKVKTILYYNSFTVINLNTGNYVVNNQTLNNTKASVNTGTMKLGKLLSGHSDIPTTWYSFDSYYNNELVQALRPFKRYSDGRRGMIDLLTGQEFYSLSNNEYQGSE